MRAQNIFKENVNISLFTDSMIIYDFLKVKKKISKPSICEFTKPAANKTKRVNYECFCSPEIKQKSEIKIYKNDSTYNTFKNSEHLR